MTEQDQRDFCPYCGSSLSGMPWDSDFSSCLPNTHYKTTRCSCGRELWLRVDFSGSGHDRWDAKTFAGQMQELEAKKNLESRVYAAKPKWKIVRKE